MEDRRSKARGALQHFVSGWLSGDYETVATLCSPTVRWWSPLRDETAQGRDETCAELDRVLARTGPFADVTGPIVSDDGSTGVVELRRRSSPGAGSATLVTSVVTLAAGKVTEGRTYMDVASGRDDTGDTP